METDGRSADGVRRGLLLAPVIFVCHFLEESPGFVAWFNSHAEPDITQSLFWTVNLYGLVITLVVVGAEWATRSAASLLVAAAWLGGLMFANAIFHVAGGILDRRYVPGLLTAALLYVPFYSWFFVQAVRSRRAHVAALLAAAVVGALPMLAHGYMILLRGSRLF